jgi:hypothetical protein
MPRKAKRKTLTLKITYSPELIKVALEQIGVPTMVTDLINEIPPQASGDVTSLFLAEDAKSVSMKYMAASFLYMQLAKESREDNPFFF